jgi:hypothetical protein
MREEAQIKKDQPFFSPFCFLLPDALLFLINEIAAGSR